MTRKRIKSEFLQKLLNAVYPKRCFLCEKIIRYDETVCPECQKQLKEAKDITYRKYAKGGYTCVSSVPYTDNFARAIINFKFHGKKQHSPQIAQVIADTVKKEYSDNHFDFITFVPMHKKNLRKRGYNQCELIAKDLSEILGIPAVATLRKTRFTKPQHELKAAKRGDNVKGAFRITDKNLVKDMDILLLDDIITTGNTLGECAKTLDIYSPRSINCVTFAISVVKTT